MIIEIDLLNPDDDTITWAPNKEVDIQNPISEFDPNRILQKQVQTIDGSIVEI